MTTERDKFDDRFQTAFWVLMIAFGIAVVCGLIWPLGSPQARTAAELGDSFGMLNALVSAVGCAGLIATLWMQLRELKYQRDELQESQDTWKAQTKALLLSAFIQVETKRTDSKAYLESLNRMVREEIHQLRSEQDIQVARTIFRELAYSAHSLMECRREKDHQGCEFHLTRIDDTLRDALTNQSCLGHRDAINRYLELAAYCFLLVDSDPTKRAPDFDRRLGRAYRDLANSLANLHRFDDPPRV